MMTFLASNTYMILHAISTNYHLMSVRFRPTVDGCLAFFRLDVAHDVNLPGTPSIIFN